MCWLLGGKNVKLDNIVLKYEILSILLILLFHQQFVIMAAATVVVAPSKLMQVYSILDWTYL